MTIVQVESYRDTKTNRFVSKEKGRAALKANIKQPNIDKLDLAGGGGQSDLLTPLLAIKEILINSVKFQSQLVTLAQSSLAMELKGDRDKSLAAADTAPIFPKPTKEEGGGQGAPIEFPEIGPKMGLALMLGGLALLFKFSDKIIPVIAKALEIGKSVYNNTLDFIDATKENLKGAITGPGTVIAGLKLFRVDLVKAIKSSRLFGFIASGFGLLDVASGGPPGATKAGLLTRIMRIFKPLTDLCKTLAKMPVIKQIGTFFGKAGGFLKMLGKLFLPFTIIIALFDTIKGTLDGYKESDEETWSGKIIDGLAGGITGLVNSLIGIPLDFLLDALEWILGKMGFDKEAEALSKFSFAEEIAKIIDSLFGYIKSAVKWVGTLFTDPVEALKQLWEGLVGEGGLLDILYAPIDAAIGWIMGVFGFDEPDTALTDEEGNFIGLKQLAINSVMWVWEKVKSFFKFGADKLGIELPSFPSIKDMIFNAVGGLLPEPDRWYSRALYKAFPDLKKVRAAFEAGGSFEDGKFVMPDTSAEVNSIEVEPNMDLETATKESMNLKEGAIPGTTIIDNKTVNGGDTVSADTYNTNDLGVDSTDPTALIGQAPWLTNPAFK